VYTVILFLPKFRKTSKVSLTRSSVNESVDFYQFKISVAIQAYKLIFFILVDYNQPK
jgi:CDP-glycerol glycerophosphotransferase (TagB/SpsB family)